MGLAGVTAARVVEGAQGDRTWRQPTRDSGGGRLRDEDLASGFCSWHWGRGALLRVRALRRARVLQGSSGPVCRAPGAHLGGCAGSTVMSESEVLESSLDWG